MGNSAKINQVTIGRDGLPVANQLDVDSNRLSVYSETLFRWSNALALPSRGTYTDVGVWVLSVAVPFRLLDSLEISGVIPLLLFAALGLLLLAVPVVLTWQAWCARRHLRLAIMYRVLLTVIGFAIATGGLW